MELVAAFDAVFVRTAAQFAHRSEGLDRLVMHLHGLELAKGGVLVAVLAWIWFASSPERQAHRASVLKTIVAGLAAALISRAIQNFLPVRPRPMNAAPDFVAPFGLAPGSVEFMQSWSSFPSDHAGLFFALVAGMWLIDRRIGFAASLWTVIVICLPRIYVGLHYASDIIAGAAFGLGAMLLAWRLPDRAFAPLFSWEKHRPGPFYAAAFLFCYEFAQLFSDVRTIASQLVRSIRLIAGA